MSSNNSSVQNTTSGNPSKTSGQLHSLKGTAVETVGNLMGKDSWTQSGKEEHTAGEAEINAAQAKGYAGGTFDRLAGKKDTIIGAMTGDRGQEASGNLRHDKGQTKQEINK